MDIIKERDVVEVMNCRLIVQQYPPLQDWILLGNILSKVSPFTIPNWFIVLPFVYEMAGLVALEAIELPVVVVLQLLLSSFLALFIQYIVCNKYHSVSMWYVVTC